MQVSHNLTGLRRNWILPIILRDLICFVSTVGIGIIKRIIVIDWLVILLVFRVKGGKITMMDQVSLDLMVVIKVMDSIRLETIRIVAVDIGLKVRCNIIQVVIDLLDLLVGEIHQGLDQKLILRTRQKQKHPHLRDISLVTSNMMKYDKC